MSSQQYNRVAGISYEECDFVIYETCFSEDDTIPIYDGEKYRNISFKEFNEERLKPHESGRMYINKEEYGNFEDMQSAYRHICVLSDKLSKLTYGLINLRKSGTIKKTALKFFYDLMNDREHKFLANRSLSGKGVILPPIIKDEEAKVLQASTTKSMSWSEEYRGEAFKYDVNSFYASILRDKNFMIPIEEPEHKKLDEKEFKEFKYYPIGLYKVDITYTNEKQKKLFQLNISKWYTHYELSHAKKIGLQMKPILKGVNFLFYGRKKCKTGSEIFGRYVGFLHETLKMNNDPDIKLIGKRLLAIIWGSLFEKNVITMVLKADSDTEIADDRKILETVLLPNGDCRIKFIKGNSYFKTRWARVAPFLIGKGKVEISLTYAKYVDNIKRVHTDGFSSDKKLPIKLSTELGGLKLERHYEDVQFTTYMQTIDMTKVETDSRESAKLKTFEKKKDL